MDDTIRFGIELRKKLRAVRREFEEKERDPARRWFFDPFVPQRVSIRDAALEGATHEVPWEHVSTDLLARDPRFWALAPGEFWHGFTSLEQGFAMTDPAKLTLLTPGFDRRPAPTRRMACPRRWLRNICARTGWWRRSSISTRCFFC